MNFNTIASVSLADNITATVEENAENGKRYFNLRMLNEGRPTFSGIFLYADEAMEVFAFLKDKMNSSKRKFFEFPLACSGRLVSVRRTTVGILLFANKRTPSSFDTGLYVPREALKSLLSNQELWHHLTVPAASKPEKPADNIQ